MPALRTLVFIATFPCAVVAAELCAQSVALHATPPVGRAGEASAPLGRVHGTPSRQTSAAERERAAVTNPLPGIFSDGVVLQRNVPIPVWGFAPPRTTVSVTFGGATLHTTSGADSAWRVRFPAHAAGGPFTLTASVGDAQQTVRDVLVGDVWVASGQSNMEWKLADARNGAAEVANAHDDQLRQFKVPNSWSWKPENELTGGNWVAANSKAAGNFTAVGYFFARELRESLHVPIGIINSAWSGASIEPYLSKGALHLTDTAWSAIKAREADYARTIRGALAARIGPLPTVDAGMVNGKALWAAVDFDDSGWKELRTPGAWEQAGYAGLDGVAWLRTSITLTNAEASQRATLSLGTVDDDDITFINGVEVGRTNGYNLARMYDVPANALHAGRNIIAVRVTDGSGDGGIIARNEQLYLQTGNTRHSLVGSWKFQVAIAALAEDAQHVNKIPTILYNRMVHPLLPFPIKGVIWYQGEPNSNNDAQAIAYRQQFAALIQSWRKDWQGSSSTFPFLWVQLPNYGTVDVTPPATGGWALLRESQSAALALPNTAQAVTIDVGEAAVLHPTNKQDVGHRLALAAMHVAYKHDTEYSGPVYRSHTVSGNKMTVTFNHAAGLVSRAESDTLVGFAIAGADKHFVWAHARVAGNRVVVWSDEVMNPVAVRYAWGNSPRSAKLYNGAGLPASPLRTDK